MTEKRIQWETYVPIFRNRYILKGLGLAIGIPFGAIIAIIIIASGGDMDNGAQYALILIAALLVLTVVAVLALYGGRYAPGFVIDDKGVTNYTQARQAKKNRAINKIATAIGIASGNFAAAGAGMIAQSRQVMYIKWKEVRKVKYDDKRNTVLIRGGYLQKIAVFCTPENYGQVKAAVRERTGESPE